MVYPMYQTVNNTKTQKNPQKNKKHTRFLLFSRSPHPTHQPQKKWTAFYFLFGNTLFLLFDALTTPYLPLTLQQRIAFICSLQNDTRRLQKNHGFH